MELFDASRQWATRPEDEKFYDMQTAYEQSLAYARIAHEKADVVLATLRAEATDGDVCLVGKGNMPAKLTHWAFGQLAGYAGAPAGYLRSLPATLAVQNINHGLKSRYEGNGDATVNMLVHANGNLLVRAFNSDRYSRIWNHELLCRMLDFARFGWRNPVPFAETAAAHEGQRGEPTIYVSDHDCFIFQVNQSNRIAEPGNPEGLGRGFFVINSEVGAAKLRVVTFLYRFICGNHIVWGANGVKEIAVRHVGDAHDRVLRQMDALQLEMRRYADSSASDDEARVARAQSFVFPATKKDEMLDSLFSLLKGKVTRGALEASYKAVVPELDGPPATAWGLAQGMTRYSQTLPYADDRVALDRAAGAVVEMAF